MSEEWLKFAIPIALGFIGGLLHLYQRITKLEEKWEFFWKVYGEELIARVKRNPHTPELNRLLDTYKERRPMETRDFKRLIELLASVQTEPDRTKEEKAAAKSLLAIIEKGW